MLEIRPNCECCNKDLPPDSLEAMICIFECTFCEDCADETLHGTCSNCGGNLVSRPVRPQILLNKYPSSTFSISKQSFIAGTEPSVRSPF